MGEQVSVGGTAVVVAREDCVKVDNTLTVGLLNTAQVCRVPFISSVVSRNRDTTVDTSGIRFPDVNKSTRDRAAGVDIDVLDFEMNINTVRVELLFHILADNFTPHIVGTVGNGRGQDAAGVGAKGLILGVENLRAIAHCQSVVVVDGLPPF